MAKTYTVQSGDNLSTIAKNNGTTVDKISGYASGNASLIRPGEVLTIGGDGGGGGNAPANSDASAGGGVTNPFDFNQQYKSAIQTLMPDYNIEAGGIKTAGDITTKSFDTLAANVQNQEPLIRSQYAALAESLSVDKKNNLDFAAKQDQASVGNAQAAAASAGLSQATGSFYQPVQSAQDHAVKDQTDISLRYQADSQKNQATMNSEIGQLNTKAAEYTAQGQQALAQVYKETAQLKSSFDQQARSLASAYVAAANEQAKFQIQEKHLQLQEEHNASMEQISAERMNLAEQRYSDSQKTAEVKITGSGGYNFFDAKGQAIPAAEYAKLTHNTLMEVMGGSNDPNDRDFVATYQSAQQKIAKGDTTRSQATANLNRLFTNLGHITID